MKMLTIKQAEFEAMEKEVESKTAELEVKGKAAATKDKAFLDLQVELCCAKEALTVMISDREEQRRVVDLASKVKVPPEAPRIRDWYVEREAIIVQACDRLGVGSSTTSSSSEEPRVVGLAGPSGAGKSTVASMVVARKNVRAVFHKGVLWLQVGKGAKGHLPELMSRLAEMVFEAVMLKTCRQPRRASIESDPEDGVAYIQEVVDERNRRFLVVADDVWEVEVLRELEKAGLWVLYTTRNDGLLPEPALWLAHIQKEEAELVIRRAAELADDVPLPKAAYDLMELCEFSVMHLAFVGRWSMVHGRCDEEAWQKVMDCITEAQGLGECDEELTFCLILEDSEGSNSDSHSESEGEERLEAMRWNGMGPWRPAVLRAGLAELACYNQHNQELYLALAVIPKGLAFQLEAVAVLLHGFDFSPKDLEAATKVAATLERWSILTLEAGGMYRVHDDHADFVQGCFAAYQNTRLKTLRRWKKYISSVRALVSYSSFRLVEIWEEFERHEGSGVISKPFDGALHAVGFSGAEFSKALGRAARFHWRRKDWAGAYAKNLRLLQIKESTVGLNSLEAAGILHSLGACRFNEERRVEAADFFRQALAIRKERLDDDDLEVARTLYSLGVCVYTLGQTKEAEECHHQALSIREGKLGADHPDVAKVLHSLGVCVDSVGRDVEAERYFLRALIIREAKLRPGHPDLSSTAHELVRCAGDEELEKIVQRLLALREDRKDTRTGISFPVAMSASGPAVYSVGPCARPSTGMEESESDSLSDARCRGMEESELSRLSLRRALGQKLKVEWRKSAPTLQKLAGRALKRGRKLMAKEYLELALAVEEEGQSDRLHLSNTLNKIGACALGAGREDEAEGFHLRALDILEYELGVNHPKVALTLACLGMCACNRGRTAEAVDYIKQALIIRCQNLSGNHLDVAQTQSDIGDCTYGAERTEEAEKLYRRALTIVEEMQGVDRPRSASTNRSQTPGSLMAAAYFQRALTTRGDELGADDPNVAYILSPLGSCTSKTGSTEEV